MKFDRKRLILGNNIGRLYGAAKKEDREGR